MWFRALLVLMVLAGVVAVAAPYILDATNPPTKSTIASRPQSGPAPTPSPTPTPMASSFAPADTAPSPPAPSERAGADTPVPALPAASAQVGATDKASAGDKPRATASASTKVAAAEKSAKSTPTEKSADNKDAPMVAAASETKSEAKSSTKPVASATTGSVPRASASGEWWVQVGAYRDESTARKLAERLRDQNYTVQESTKSAAADQPSPATPAAKPAGVDQYDVFVSNTSTTDLNPRLAAKGLTAEPSGSGVVVKPSLPLRDAVALSKDLATDGLKVQVRRAGSPTGETTIPASAKRPTPVVSNGASLYRVRVGAFPDHATAVTTLKELEAKGYKPFIARGGS
jgi:cell division septation protein DedD